MCVWGGGRGGGRTGPLFYPPYCPQMCSMVAEPYSRPRPCLLIHSEHLPPPPPCPPYSVSTRPAKRLAGKKSARSSYACAKLGHAPQGAKNVIMWFRQASGTLLQPHRGHALHACAHHILLQPNRGHAHARSCSPHPASAIHGTCTCMHVLTASCS